MTSATSGAASGTADARSGGTGGSVGGGRLRRRLFRQSGRHDYEAALWLTVSGLGDRDTTCAIVGGIVITCTGSEGIPAD